MTAPAWLTLPKPMYRGVAAAAGWTDTARVSKCLGAMDSLSASLVAIPIGRPFRVVEHCSAWRTRAYTQA